MPRHTILRRMVEGRALGLDGSVLGIILTIQLPLNREVSRGTMIGIDIGRPGSCSSRRLLILAERPAVCYDLGHS